MMNPSLHPLAFALLLAIHGTAVAVPTVSTPIPKAVLAVQQTLEAKTSRLGEALANNAEALEQAAEALDNCNAELPDGHQPDPAHSSRYLECRQTALGETQRVYDKLVNAFDDFAGDISKIRKQIDSTITYNQRMIEQYQKKQRKVALALKKSRARARAVADSLPAEGRPSRKQLNEMRRLASDIQFAETLQKVTRQTLAGLRANGQALESRGQTLDAWRDEAESLAYDYRHKRDLIDRIIASGVAIGQSRVLIDQFEGADVSRISTLIQRLRGFDIGNLLGPGVLPLGKDSPPANFLGGEEELIDFFRKLRNQ